MVTKLNELKKAKIKRGGVYVIDGKIKIGFSLDGKQYKEIYEGTEANAHKHRAKVITAIEHGIFSFEKWFPKSIHAKKSQVLTFAEASAEWLRTKKGGRASAFRTNTTKKKFWDDHLGDYLLTEITKTQIKIILAEAEQDNRTLVNYLTCVREVFDTALDEDIVTKSPVFAKSKKYSLGFQHPDPEPLEFHEVDRLLGYLGKLELKLLQVRNYIQFAIWTGLRTAELISIRWDDIDWVKSTIRINKSRVKDEVNNAKENRIREVYLYPEAIAALKHQEQYTKLIKAEIFFDPLTKKPWAGDKNQRVTYWHPALYKLGIKGRDCYATRDTYASILISKGQNIHTICNQLGHSSVTTTMRHYGKMFESAHAAEFEKMEAQLKREAEEKEKATLAAKVAS